MSAFPNRWYGPLGLSLALSLAVASFSGTRNPAVESVKAAAAQGSTTLDDQVDLNVTVYNSDIALVRDVRNARAPARNVRPELHGHRGHRESMLPFIFDR